MTAQRQPLNESDRTDLRLRIEAALAGFMTNQLVVDVSRDGAVALRGVAPDEATRREIIAVARQAAGRAIDADFLGLESLAEYPADRLDPQAPAGAQTADEPALAAASEDRDGTEIDFNDENVGTADVMEAIAEAEPWTPPTDPVELPADTRESIEVVGGFATTATDGSLDPQGEPARLQQGDAEIEEDVRESLRRDAATAHLSVDVRVRSGVVVLDGTVQSIDDVESAEEVAARVPGVIEVREHLNIESYEGA